MARNIFMALYPVEFTLELSLNQQAEENCQSVKNVSSKVVEISVKYTRQICVLSRNRRKNPVQVFCCRRCGIS